MKIGEVSKPRFEFRSFGQCFCEAHKRMARLSMPVPEKVWERLSDEIYIISRKNDINNTKIRDGKMDIKTFVQSVDGLEQWNPLMKGEFSISREVLEKEVFPAFMVEMPKLTKDTPTWLPCASTSAASATWSTTPSASLARYSSMAPRW